MFNQNMQAGQFANDAQRTAYAQDAGNIDRENAARQQIFNQNMGAAGLANDAQQVRFNQGMANQQFANDAQNQQAQQTIANRETTNNALQQAYQNQNTAVAANNTEARNQFNQRMALANASDQRRQQFIAEDFAYRNQPINEITALLSGSQVNSPNFAVNTPGAMPTTDVAGIISDNYNQRLDAARMRNSGSQSLLGGLFGLGSAGIMGGLFG